MRISDWSSDVCSSDLNVTHPIQYRADGASRGPHKIYVLRIAQRLLEVQLVQRRSTPEPQLISKKRIAEQFDERAADEEVLLDLPLFRPRCHLRPGDDIHRRDHSSISGRR